MSGPLLPLGDPGPWSGGAVTERATCVLAGNPGPMTLEGTNTWVLREPGAAAAVVVDPGPDDEVHLRAVLDAADGRVALVLLTHGHPDHAEGARSFAELSGAPVRALDPEHRFGGEGLVDGDRVDAHGLVVEVVSTPGHTADSLTFRLAADGSLLTGDTVLGRGTTVVAHPDGRLADYLASLHRLRDLAESAGPGPVLPGHGPVLPDPVAAVSSYLRHREERLEQVRRVWDDGVRDPDAVVEIVYADVPREVLPAARLSVLAQLDYLEGR